MFRRVIRANSGCVDCSVDVGQVEEEKKKMNAEKISSNVEFTVKYADGTCKDVPEGVLFEFQGNAIILHIGTYRKECLFSIAEALTEMLCEMVLYDEFERYVESALKDDYPKFEENYRRM